MSKHIKISLFDNNQFVEIVNDSVAKITYNNTDTIIRLSNISSMEYTENKYIHKVHISCYLFVAIQIAFVWYNYYYSNLIDNYWYIFFSGVLMLMNIGLIWDYEESSFLKLVVNKLVISTHDNTKYTIRHFVNIEKAIYKETETYSYTKKLDYYKVSNTLLKLKEDIIQAKSKTII